MDFEMETDDLFCVRFGFKMKSNGWTYGLHRAPKYSKAPDVLARSAYAAPAFSGFSFRNENEVELR